MITRINPVHHLVLPVVAATYLLCNPGVVGDLFFPLYKGLVVLNLVRGRLIKSSATY